MENPLRNVVRKIWSFPLNRTRLALAYVTGGVYDIKPLVVWNPFMGHISRVTHVPGDTQIQDPLGIAQRQPIFLSSKSALQSLRTHF